MRVKGIAYLNYLVFLCLVDLSSEAAARESVMNDEFVGFEAWFFEEFWTCKYKQTQIQIQAHLF